MEDPRSPASHPDDWPFPTGRNAESWPGSLLPGRPLADRYHLRECVGRGGMAVVWRAWDERLQQVVALKFLRAHFPWDEGSLHDLRQETRAARLLSHPHIVRVHDLIEAEGLAAIAMEFIEGRSLQQWRLSGPDRVLDPTDLRPLLPGLAAALDYAHQEARLVHRDLKPANVMVTTQGQPKLTDFGIARLLLDTATLATNASVGGTLAYMSPQQLFGEAPSPADDLYSLGAMLYDLLGGRPPFHTGNLPVQIQQKAPPCLNQRRAQVVPARPPLPAIWIDTLAACLAKDPRDRPATAGQVALALDQGRALPPRRRWFRGWRPPGSPPSSRRPVLLASLAALLTILWWVQPDGPPAAARRPPPAATPPAATAPGPADPSLYEASTDLSAFPAPAGLVPEVRGSDRAFLVAHLTLDGHAREAEERLPPGRLRRVQRVEDRFGRPDRALRFPGNAGLEFDLPPGAPPQWPDPFTVAFWCRLESESERILTLHPEDGGQVFVEIGLHEGYPQLAFGATNTFEQRFRTASPIQFGQWHHFVLTANATELKFYLDGELTGRFPAPTRSLGRGGGHTLRVGSVWGGGRLLFTGSLDDFRLYHHALSEDYVASWFQATPPAAPQTDLDPAELARRLRLFTVSPASLLTNDDRAAAIAAEFGPGATLADWEEVKRLFAGHGAALIRHLQLEEGVGLEVQRGGRRSLRGNRFYGLDYFPEGHVHTRYLVHDTLDDGLLTLGSWYDGKGQSLVRLPGRGDGPPLADSPPSIPFVEENWAAFQGESGLPGWELSQFAQEDPAWSGDRLWARRPQGRVSARRVWEVSPAGRSLVLNFTAFLPLSPWGWSQRICLEMANGREWLVEVIVHPGDESNASLRVGRKESPRLDEILLPSGAARGCLVLGDGGLFYRLQTLSSDSPLAEIFQEEPDFHLAELCALRLELEAARDADLWLADLQVREIRRLDPAANGGNSRAQPRLDQ